MYSHTEKPIYVGTMFCSVAKHDYWGTLPNGKRRKTEKYSIAQRFVGPQDRHRFRPDHERLWYFESKDVAEWYVKIWKREDRYNKKRLSGETV